MNKKRLKTESTYIKGHLLNRQVLFLITITRHIDYNKDSI